MLCNGFRHLDAHSDARANSPTGRSTTSAPVAERELRTWGCTPCTATATGSYPAAVAPLQSRTRLSPQWPAAPLAKFSMRPTRVGVVIAVTVPTTFHKFEGEGN